MGAFAFIISTARENDPDQLTKRSHITPHCDSGVTSAHFDEARSCRNRLTVCFKWRAREDSNL